MGGTFRLPLHGRGHSRRARSAAPTTARGRCVRHRPQWSLTRRPVHHSVRPHRRWKAERVSPTFPQANKPLDGACVECRVPRCGRRIAMSVKDFEILRRQMLAEIAAGTFHVSDLIGKAALGERVMAAMAKVPRHEFVPVELQPYAYANIPLPIGFEKTISQPFIVALMTDLLDIGPEDTVLEVGTGLGYQAAILAQLARKVYSIEIIEELARQ